MSLPPKSPPPPRFPREIPAGGDPAPYHHAQRWLEHVSSGLIPSDPQTHPAQMLRHLRNEETLLGRARTVKFATPEAYRGRS